MRTPEDFLRSEMNSEFAALRARMDRMQTGIDSTQTTLAWLKGTAETLPWALGGIVVLATFLIIIACGSSAKETRELAKDVLARESAARAVTTQPTTPSVEAPSTSH